jgi:DNA primase
MTLFDTQNGYMVSLCGEMMVNRVNKLINENVKDVYLCFDNDEKGNDFFIRIKDILKNYKLNIYRLIPRNKDWNEDLLKNQ